MSFELLPMIARVLDEARGDGLDGVGQMRRAVAEVLRLAPHMPPIDALRVVEVARTL